MGNESKGLYEFGRGNMSTRGNALARKDKADGLSTKPIAATQTGLRADLRR